MENIITWRRNVLSLSKLESGPLEINSGKLAYIRHFQRIGINETKFEKMVIHFKSDVFTAVAVMNAKLPSTLSNLKICFLLICFHQMLPCKSFWYNKKIKKSYWTTVANTSPYASAHSSCAHLKTWKCQIFRSPPAPPLHGAKRWQVHYNIYPLLLLRFSRLFILHFFFTISFICSSFALIFFEPVFTSSDSWLARSRWTAVVLKDLEPKQHMGECLVSERRLAETLLSVERWDPRKPTLDKKAAGTAYLSFGGKYLNLKHFVKAEFRRSAWHIEQAPAMFLSFVVTNPSA